MNKPQIFHRKVLIIILLSVVAIMAVISQLGFFNSMKNATASFVSPVGQGFVSVFGFLGKAPNRFKELSKLESENKDLKEEIAKLQTENAAFAEKQKELSTIVEDINVVYKEPIAQKIFARVIGREPENYAQYLRLDEGSEAGLKDGMAVTYKGMLLARIRGVKPKESRALLISSYASVVQVKHESSGTTAVVRGGLSGMVMSNYPKDAQLKVGDRIVTSGLDGVLPAGLILGTVDEIKTNESDFFKEAKIKEPVLVSEIESVIVESR